MARYERIEGTTQRFWEIEVDGRFVIIRWGHLGGTVRPQSRTIECSDEEMATARRDLLVHQKTSSGYRRVDIELDDARTGTGNPELENALAADPEDLESRLVYADWLMSQDATLGELIAIEVEYEQTGNQELLSPIARLRKRCLGEVGDRRSLTVSWRLGLVRRARLAVMGSGASLLGQLLGLPAARVLETLRLDTQSADNPPADRAAMLTALGRCGPPHLRTLALHHRPAGADRNFTEAEGWWDGLPSLDGLLVFSEGAGLPLPNAQLRVFGFDAQQLPWHPTLLEPWPRLEHLVLERVPNGLLLPLLDAIDAPELHTLALDAVDLESVPWRQLFASRTGRTLRTIEIRDTVPVSLRGLLDRLGHRITVRACGSFPNRNADWLERAPALRYSSSW